MLLGAEKVLVKTFCAQSVLPLLVILFAILCNDSVLAPCVINLERIALPLSASFWSWIALNVVSSATCCS